jgi:hypothetical protein
MVKSNPTYSVGTTAIRPRNPFNVTVTLPDSDADGNNANTFSALQGVMTKGNQVLCKMQDGSLRWHRIDAERSRNGVYGKLYYVLPI